MKFFATAAMLLPAMALALPQQSPANALVVREDLDKGAFIEQLIRENKIQVTDDDDALTKRSNVPGLHCGYARALRCLANSAGALNSCIWAVLHAGLDLQDDTGCIAAATAVGSNLSNDCKLCLQDYL